MAKTARASKPAKLSRPEKKALRAAKRAQRRELWSNVGKTFQLTRQSDNRLLPYMVGIGVVAAVVAYLILFTFAGPWIPIPFAILGRAARRDARVQPARAASMFTPGRGPARRGRAGCCSSSCSGDWRLTQAVAGTTQLDAVHRLVGRPGVVLVGEGAPHRVAGLIAQEKKKIARVAGDTPIYDVIVGTGEGDVRLGKLNRYLLKLPANLSKEQVGALEKRLAALGGARAPLPQGPMPQGAKMRNVQRTVRRRLAEPMPDASSRRPAGLPRRAPRPARQSGPGSLAPTGVAARRVPRRRAGLVPGGRAVRPPTAAHGRPARPAARLVEPDPAGASTTSLGVLLAGRTLGHVPVRAAA